MTDMIEKQAEVEKIKVEGCDLASAEIWYTSGDLAVIIFRNDNMDETAEVATFKLQGRNWSDPTISDNIRDFVVMRIEKLELEIFKDNLLAKRASH